MHLAFWDGLSLSKFEEGDRTGKVQVPPMRDMVDGINQAMLPWWRTIAPAQIRHAVVAAAEAVDHKGETLPARTAFQTWLFDPRFQGFFKSYKNRGRVSLMSVDTVAGHQSGAMVPTPHRANSSTKSSAQALSFKDEDDVKAIAVTG